jgi:hypothetical protein
MFPQQIITFHCRENTYGKCICLIEIWITLSQKELAKPQSQIPSIYFKKGNNKFKGQSLQFFSGNTNLLVQLKFQISLENMLFFMLATERARMAASLILYLSPEYHNSRQTQELFI